MAVIENVEEYRESVEAVVEAVIDLPDIYVIGISVGLIEGVVATMEPEMARKVVDAAIQAMEKAIPSA